MPSTLWAPAESVESDNKKKNTSLSFGWMREGHYPRFLYRDVEFKEGESKPRLYVSKEEHPTLWDHMEALENMDLDMSAIKYIILRLSYWTIEDKFSIQYYEEWKKKWDESKWAGKISILELKPEEVVELVKRKISEAQQSEK